MLDVVVAGIRRVRSVHFRSLPRQADFYKWGAAVEVALGYEPETFVAAYRGNLADMTALALEASPIAWVLHDFLAEQPDRMFYGTAQELLAEVTDFAVLREGLKGPQALVRRHPQWPKCASQMSAEINRIEHNLAKVGMQFERSRTKAKRFIRLRMTAVTTAEDVQEEPVTAQSTAG